MGRAFARALAVPASAVSMAIMPGFRSALPKAQESL
jgi:hypothetical protein